MEQSRMERPSNLEAVLAKAEAELCVSKIEIDGKTRNRIGNRLLHSGEMYEAIMEAYSNKVPQRLKDSNAWGPDELYMIAQGIAEGSQIEPEVLQKAMLINYITISEPNWSKVAAEARGMARAWMRDRKGEDGTIYIEKDYKRAAFYALIADRASGNLQNRVDEAIDKYRAVHAAVDDFGQWLKALNVEEQK